MAFAKKMSGFSSDLVSFSTKQPKIRAEVLQGELTIFDVLKIKDQRCLKTFARCRNISLESSVQKNCAKVKNLREPCKKGHGFLWSSQVISRPESTAVWPKLTPNSMTISCHSSRFYLFSMLRHDMDFGQFQVMEF